MRTTRSKTRPGSIRPSRTSGRSSSMYARTGAGPPLTVRLSKNAGRDAGIVSSWGTPTRPTAPPGRAMPTAVSIDCSRPTHSRTEWTPKPPVSSRTRSTASLPRSLTTSVAPNSCASAIRSGWRPRMMIRSAPRRFAAITPHRPTAPSPTTATVLPGPTSAATAAWWPVPITSERVRSDVISAWSLPTGRAYSVPSAWGTRTASACAPATSTVPKNPPWMHDVCSPSWQKTQVPSEYANGMTTTSPTFMVRTSAPTASTTPIASCPMWRPVSLCSIVLYGQRSLPQMEARLTAMSASVCSTRRASGTVSTRTSPAPYMTVARMSALDRRGGGVLLVGYVVTPRRGVALVVDLEHCEVGHEAGRGRAVPVILARLEEDAVAGPDHLDRPAAALCEADALRDVDRLAVRVRVPGRSCARREVDAARAQTRGARRRRHRIHVDGAGEPLAWPCVRVDAVPGDLHGHDGAMSLLDEVAPGLWRFTVTR